jgi:hypothetical protein
MLTIAITIPSQFFQINFSLKMNNPNRVERITIPTLFSVNAVELSIPSVLRAFKRYTIEK